MVHLFAACGEFLLAAAVDDECFGAEALGGAHGVHGNVAATHYHATLADAYRGVVGIVVCVHEVGARQHLVGREDAVEVFTLDAHEAGEPGAGADEDGVVAFAVEQLVDAQCAAHDDIGLYLHAEAAHGLYLFGDNLILGKAELRYAVDKHAANLVERLEYFHLIAELGEVGGAGQSGRTGTYHGHAFAVARRGSDGFGIVFYGVVAHEAFQLADGHRLALDAEHAGTLALVFLRADAAAHTGQRAVAVYHLGGSGEVAFRHLLDESRDVYMHGALRNAARLGAVEATRRLCLCLFGIVAVAHFFKICGADFRVLFAHRYTGNLVSHGNCIYGFRDRFSGCCGTCSGDAWPRRSR